MPPPSRKYVASFLIAELGAHVLIDHRGVGRTNVGHAGIEIVGLAGVHGRGADQAAIQAARHHFLIAKQLTQEVHELDAQPGTLDILRIEARQLRILRDRGFSSRHP